MDHDFTFLLFRRNNNNVKEMFHYYNISVDEHTLIQYYDWQRYDICNDETLKKILMFSVTHNRIESPSCILKYLEEEREFHIKKIKKIKKNHYHVYVKFLFS